MTVHRRLQNHAVLIFALAVLLAGSLVVLDLRLRDAEDQMVELYDRVEALESREHR